MTVQRPCSLPGTVWIASREHVDSFVDLSPAALVALGPLVARIERAVLAERGVGRVHLYRWGDGAAHFHAWLMPRPLGMLEASERHDAAVVGGHPPRRP